jgi:glycine cleavage system H protein
VNIPEGLRYTRQHEWVLIDGESARIGITDLAQDALGNIVHVQLKLKAAKA